MQTLDGVHRDHLLKPQSLLLRQTSLVGLTQLPIDCFIYWRCLLYGLWIGEGSLFRLLFFFLLHCLLFLQMNGRHERQYVCWVFDVALQHAQTLQDCCIYLHHKYHHHITQGTAEMQHFCCRLFLRTWRRLRRRSCLHMRKHVAVYVSL